MRTQWCVAYVHSSARGVEHVHTVVCSGVNGIGFTCPAQNLRDCLDDD